MKYGLIGEKLGHSFSKLIHSFIGDYEYELKEINREDLGDFFRKKDFKAINVTIPYKQAVIEFLDFIDQPAKEIGAVNTIVNKNGKLYGYNTDYYGLKSLILKNYSSFSDKSALILGTGGTSKNAYSVLKDLGVKNIYKVSRNPEENQISYSKAEKINAQIIINTTPCGMYPNSFGSAIDINKFNNLELVIDAVYNPIKTDLILDALSRGITAEGGLYMLAAQAVKAAEYFFEKEFNSEITDEIFGKVLNIQRNIVLTGMPASGKSTIGAYLAEKLNKPFIDTDKLIEDKIKMPISEFFAEYGEEKFRTIESEVIKEISDLHGYVIATGGGSVLKQENIRCLKHNGIICFLDRPLSELIPTSDRPLSNNYEDIKKRYHERIDIYNSTCDFKVLVTNPITTSEKIIKETKNDC